jgi:hypothetical protein
MESGLGFWAMRSASSVLLCKRKRLCLFFSTAIERRYRSEDPGGSKGNSKDLDNDLGNSRILF